MTKNKLWVIITFASDNDIYPDVGMNERLPMSGCTTEQGYLRRAATYHRNYRAEFFRKRLFDGEPYKTVYQKAGASL